MDELTPDMRDRIDDLRVMADDLAREFPALTEGERVLLAAQLMQMSLLAGARLARD